jgi:hypothetical protein
MSRREASSPRTAVTDGDGCRAFHGYAKSLQHSAPCPNRPAPCRPLAARSRDNLHNLRYRCRPRRRCVRARICRPHARSPDRRRRAVPPVEIPALGDQTVTAGRRQPADLAHCLRRQLNAVRHGCLAIVIVLATTAFSIEQRAADRSPGDLGTVPILELVETTEPATIAEALHSAPVISSRPFVFQKGISPIKSHFHKIRANMETSQKIAGFLRRVARYASRLDCRPVQISS